MQNAHLIPNHLTHSQLFRQLAGAWQLKRIILSACPTLPSGTFMGEATFVPQTPTTPGFHKEYRYQERGHFTSTQSTVLYSQQTYIYRLQTQPEAISVWSTEEEHQALSEMLHRLDIIIAQPHTNTPYYHYLIQATPHHCKQDQYQVDYQFYFTEEQLEHWFSTYAVKGPKKNYRIENHYTRPHVTII